MVEISDECVWTLNVGGKLFHVSGSTLISEQMKDSMITTLVSAIKNGSMDTTRDDKGHIYFERDPECFEIILAFLRTGRLALLPDGPVSWESVHKELDYFGIKYKGASPILDALDGILEIASTSADQAKNLASKLNQYSSKRKQDHIMKWVNGAVPIVLQDIKSAADRGDYSTTIVITCNSIVAGDRTMGLVKRLRRQEKLKSLLRRQISVVKYAWIKRIKDSTESHLHVTAKWKKPK
jgi:hypothetical protein